MVDPKKSAFWPRINMPPRKNLSTIPTSNDSSSKSAKIVLSKLILDVKNESNFFKKKLSKHINIGDRFLEKSPFFQTQFLNHYTF